MPHQIAATSQRLAAHPNHSAWVAASAGSGKTKVLTDRVLNLLLEGCPPERILCLTFTKAAAAEMANRVRMRLGEWAILPENDLRQTIEDLQGAPASSEKLERARTLFCLTLDTPDGLKIQTIHSFCQSLLKRFPLEAGLTPFFEVADDTEQHGLIKKASQIVLENPTLQVPLQELILRFSESTLEELNSFILQSRTSFETCVSQEIDETLQTINITKEGLLKSLITNIPEEELKKGIPLLEQGSPTDQERGKKLSLYFSLSENEKIQNYESYLIIFLTLQGEKRARLLTQKIALASPSLKDLLEDEALRLENWMERFNALEISIVSKAFLHYSLAFLEAYENLKKAQSLLDYDDLILKTVSLLKNPGCHWVLYKLDGGLDHILVDEAQDTNPAQWQVIRAIAEEFYANAAADQRNRTLFIVGDGKQSIYSFQGADPVVFTQMQHDLRTFAKNSGKKWEDIDLTVSFRSTPEVLATVDAVFSSSPLSSMPLQHLPFRKEAPGHVEIWPLLKEEEKNPLEPWQPPLVQHSPDSPQKRLAQLMAKTIQRWLSGFGPLSTPINPGDILILVRRRTAFVDTLIRALKDLNVPVAGIDRLWLLEGIAVQDLLKIAEFLLLPEDDLTLATVLKGPLFGLSEEDLFTLAHNRDNISLWQRLQRNKEFETVSSLLNDLLSRVDFLTPFALFSTILGPLEGRKKWHSRLGSEVLDSLDEFLNLCLVFQDKKTPSLQGFLHWVSQEIIELKRDLDQSNQVRVMTVHGSKGLQAPIVFLPDTTQPPHDVPPFEFHKQALLWLPPIVKDIPLTKMLKQGLRQKQQEEYLRLLYVALTRAEDALYICGWEANHQETWYDLVQQGLQKIGEEIEFDFSPHVKGIGWRLSSIKERDVPSPKAERSPPFLLPQWLKILPPLETAPKLLRPSENGEEEPFGPSPFGEFGTQRGVLIHKLLEILPNIKEETREKAARNFLEKERIPEDMAMGMIESVRRVFQAYPDLFSTPSQGEVPIMGKLGESLLSGQIDRLIINEDHILIVDYKTHINFPEKLDDIPKTYIKQMAIYQTALGQIYPQLPVSCGILWTQVPRLDILPNSLMKKFTPSIDENEGTAYTTESEAR
ncbi:MAG: double-strand break repair helicase AddA [Alphaproteobacteria bacterium 41-28]|nr:MAG: double-strand break repair helicase AddA [Alphaproteobacteria bacterium 41-28]